MNTSSMSDLSGETLREKAEMASVQSLDTEKSSILNSAVLAIDLKLLFTVYISYSMLHVWQHTARIKAMIRLLK